MMRGGGVANASFGDQLSDREGLGSAGFQEFQSGLDKGCPQVSVVVGFLFSHRCKDKL